MNLTELSRSSYEIAKSKGWWSSPRSFSALSLLMVSELSEVVEEYRSHRAINEIYYEYKEDGVLRTCPSPDAVTMPPGTDFKPAGIPVEISDFIIRVADYAGFAGFDLGDTYNHACVTYRVPSKYDVSNLELCLSHSTLRTSLSFQAWADGNELDHHMLLAWSLQPMFDTCVAHGIDIQAVIDLKAAYNQTRSIRHGGKLI